MTPVLIIAIHETIQENKGYAQVVWKSRYDDAIDATLHHAMKYYSPEKGELRNYIVSTMKNILTNGFKKEHSTEDETLNFLVDSNQGETDGIVDIIDDSSLEVEECLSEFLLYVIDDFEFFKQLNKSESNYSYQHILSKYSSKVIVSALHRIQKEYLPQIEEFATCKRLGSAYGRGLEVEDICEKFSSGLKYRGCVRNVALVEGYSPKRLFRFDLDKYVSSILYEIYSNNLFHLTIHGIDFYRTPTWGIVNDLDSLIAKLRSYCLYFICKKNGYRVVHREGNFFYLLGDNEISYVELFKIRLKFKMESISRKEVVC